MPYKAKRTRPKNGARVEGFARPSDPDWYRNLSMPELRSTNLFLESTLTMEA